MARRPPVGCAAAPPAPPAPRAPVAPGAAPARPGSAQASGLHLLARGAPADAPPALALGAPGLLGASAVLSCAAAARRWLRLRRRSCARIVMLRRRHDGGGERRPGRPAHWLDEPAEERGDGPRGFGGDDDGDPRDASSPPGRRKNRAPWKIANEEARQDPEWKLRREFNVRRGRDWKAGMLVDKTRELDATASTLRALYKRPRFSWNEIWQDDLRSTHLSRNLPTIGTREVWLSKYLSSCGASSRREATRLVLEGRVTINGEVAQDIVVKVKPTEDVVTVDGKEQRTRTLGEVVWIMLYKPKDCVCTTDDPAGRRTIMDLVPAAREQDLRPVGRLDRNSYGLLLMTNDTEWITILEHPKHRHSKRYKVDVYNGVPSAKKLQALVQGLELPDQPYPLMPVEDLIVENVNRKEDSCRLAFNLQQGVYRQIRRMFEWIGHPVKSIKRVQIGLVRLDKELEPGQWRALRPKEIRQLKGPTILARPKANPYAGAKKNSWGNEEVAAAKLRQGLPPAEEINLRYDDEDGIREISEEEWANLGSEGGSTGYEVLSDRGQWQSLAAEAEMNKSNEANRKQRTSKSQRRGDSGSRRGESPRSGASARGDAGAAAAPAARRRGPAEDAFEPHGGLDDPPVGASAGDGGASAGGSAPPPRRGSPQEFLALQNGTFIGRSASGASSDAGSFIGSDALPPQMGSAEEFLAMQGQFQAARQTDATQDPSRKKRPNRRRSFSTRRRKKEASGGDDWWQKLDRVQARVQKQGAGGRGRGESES